MSLEENVNENVKPEISAEKKEENGNGENREEGAKPARMVSGSAHLNRTTPKVRCSTIPTRLRNCAVTVIRVLSSFRLLRLWFPEIK